MAEGYARLSRLMGRQDACAIYRRFRTLNSLNLLYLQAELTHLEQELADLAKRDSEHEDRKYYTRDWWSLSQNDEEEDVEQWEKVLEIRTKLDQYSTHIQVPVSRLRATFIAQTDAHHAQTISSTSRPR
jgi:hypothetical protein